MWRLPPQVATAGEGDDHGERQAYGDPEHPLVFEGVVVDGGHPYEHGHQTKGDQELRAQDGVHLPYEAHPNGLLREGEGGVFCLDVFHGRRDQRTFLFHQEF